MLETTPHTKQPLLIKTDSKYSIRCKSAACGRPVAVYISNHPAGFREWMPNWLRNNFKSSTGEPVKNAPLIRYLSALLDQRAREGQKVGLLSHTIKPRLN